MSSKTLDFTLKSLAGLILGMTLAIAISGLFGVLTPGGYRAPNKFQVVMWLTPPLWMSTLSLVYFFRSSLAAWGWLAGANLIAYGLLLCLTKIG